MVTPTLLYGSAEVLGYEKCDKVVYVTNKAKSIFLLCFKKSAPNIILYGEF